MWHTLYFVLNSTQFALKYYTLQTHTPLKKNYSLFVVGNNPSASTGNSPRHTPINFGTTNAVRASPRLGNHFSTLTNG